MYVLYLEVLTPVVPDSPWLLTIHDLGLGSCVPLDSERDAKPTLNHLPPGLRDRLALFEAQNFSLCYGVHNMKGHLSPELKVPFRPTERDGQAEDKRFFPDSD